MKRYLQMKKLKRLSAKKGRKLIKYPTYFASYLILVSILTGMRVGEIPVLRWLDINFEKGTIHIHRQQLFIRKTRESRRVSLHSLSSEGSDRMSSKFIRYMNKK
mgnify:FL=1